MSPVKMEELNASYAPKYKIKTIIRFKTKVIAGIRINMFLYTYKFTSKNSLFIFSNFSFSVSCLTNALITGIPINISLVVLFILSMISCVILKYGNILATTSIKSAATTTKVTNIIHERSVPSSKAFIILPIPKIGANKRVVKIIPITLWI